MRRIGVTQASGADPPPLFFISVDSSGDKVVCFQPLLKVLILRGVAGVFSISADSKALAEMERAVSRLLANPVDQCACPLYTLNNYTILFIFVKRKVA
jgi:hypothetical protein